MIAESYLQSPQAPSTADRFQVVVHADAETLRERSAGRCHLEHGPSVPVESVRRLTCDASVVPVFETEAGEVLDVGRKTRTIPAAIRRALTLRDSGCCFPGCTHRYLDAHHVKHWIDGGETKLSNLVSLCRTHHRLVHEGGITVGAGDGGGWRFVRPDGRVFDEPRDSPAPAYDGSELHATHADLGLPIDPQAAACRMQAGERMDYELGVWVLCTQTEHARRKISAEMSIDAH